MVLSHMPSLILTPSVYFELLSPWNCLCTPLHHPFLLLCSCVRDAVPTPRSQVQAGPRAEPSSEANMFHIRSSIVSRWALGSALEASLLLVAMPGAPSSVLITSSDDSCGFRVSLLRATQGLQRIHARAQLDGALGWVTLSSSPVLRRDMLFNSKWRNAKSEREGTWNP